MWPRGQAKQFAAKKFNSHQSPAWFWQPKIQNCSTIYLPVSTCIGASSSCCIAYLVARQLDASKSGSLGRLLRVPVSLEADVKSGLEFLAEDVDATSRQLVVEVRNDEIECDGQFDVHRAGFTTFDRSVIGSILTVTY